MEGDLIKTRDWLSPLSWLYGMAVTLRNWLFNVGLLHQQSYDIPVISVGNITVGGTGKTPHVEYLVRLLDKLTKVAVLSRGYKRKTKGYVLADDDSTAATIGDEPYQMKRKFKDIYVAVDANRREGIARLTTDKDTNDVGVMSSQTSTSCLWIIIASSSTTSCFQPVGCVSHCREREGPIS